MTARSMKAPGSPSSALQMRYLVSLTLCLAAFHLNQVGKPAPPRPARPEILISSMTSSGVMVFNTFSKVRAIDLYNDIVEKQEMTIIDNELYIKLSKESCNLDYQINNRDFSYTIEDGALLIDLKYLKIYAYEEEGKWKLDVNPYDCQFNVNN